MGEYVDGTPIEEMDPSEENLVFHYERGSFRNREDQRTRDLASGKINMRPGLFKVLVSTKGNRFLFFAVLICIGVSVFLGVFHKTDSGIVSGVRCTASAFSFDGSVYVTLEVEKNRKDGSDLPVSLDVLFECINAENSVADKHSESFVYVPKNKHHVRTIFPDYDLKKLRVTVKNGEIEKVLETAISQR